MEMCIETIVCGMV